MSADLPRVTFILLAYSQAAYVRAAVEGALAQDYGNLQILLSDDCSPDETHRIMSEVVKGYAGPHSVELLRTPGNLGLSRHFQSVVQKAEGEFLVLAAGDDISAPQRTRRLAEAWMASGAPPAMIYSDYRHLSPEGEILFETSPVICRTPTSFDAACRGDLEVHGGSAAITRSLLRDFAPMSPEVIYEDRVLPFRALLLGGRVIYVDEALVDYRIAGGVSRGPLDPALSHSFQMLSQERNIADARQRLADLLAKQPHDHRAARACRATIEDHRCRLAMGRGSPLLYELQALRSLSKGARPVRTARTYLRNRLKSLGMLRLVDRRSRPG